jgi:hypothetical protein
MDIVTQAKNIAAVLGTASIVTYVLGYLALRARAFALGTDPAFKLVDEAYVFAGFRVLLITLIVLLFSAPVILLVRWGTMWLARNMPPAFLQPFEWILLVAVALVTIMSLNILSASGVLLQEGSLRSSGLTAAILGEATNLRLLLSFAIVLLVVLSALWLRGRLTSTMGPFEWLLMIVVALQIVMLPIYHGALFADRRVRVLALSPDSVKWITGPLGIVDRTAEHVTLLGLDSGGNRQLATIRLDDLNGIPIKQVVALRHFIRDVLDGNSKATELAHPVSNPGLRVAESSGQTPGGEAMVSESTETETGFFSSLVEHLKITLEAIGSLGDSVVDSGELWEVDFDVSGQPSEPKRISAFDDLAWPVVGPDGSTYYALQRGRPVRLNLEGGSLQVLDQNIWSKILGVLKDGTVLGLVSHAGDTRPAMLSPSGELKVGSAQLSEADKVAVARLMQETRSHTGGRTLLVDRSERGGRGFDVFLRISDQTVNLSDCGDDSCGQASLSPDFRRALFIRQPRY